MSWRLASSPAWRASFRLISGQWISAEREALLDAAVAVLEAPAFATGLGDFEVGPTTITPAGEFAGFGLGRARLGVGERGHGGLGASGRWNPCYCPQITPAQPHPTGALGDRNSAIALPH